MNLYVLDTDHLTLLRRRSQRRGPCEQVRPDGGCRYDHQHRRAIPGLVRQVRKARDTARLARAYQGLLDVIEMARSLPVLPFAESSVNRYANLRRVLPRLGKQDLAIASIVLKMDATLVTRNRHDFEHVSGLRLEDWSAGST